jgi:DNA repair protein RecO (recombination protein O)
VAPSVTIATVLSTFPYGETSRIARLATRDFGVLSVIAKGARQPKSRFGAALQALSEGSATVRLSRRSDLHYLSDFDVQRVPVSLGTDLGKFATAQTLGELLLRFAPHEAQPQTYEFFRQSVDVLEEAPDMAAEVLGLRAMWGLVSELGFAPGFDRCAKDGAPLEGESDLVPFSAVHGGILCLRCAETADASRLGATDLSDLRAFVLGGSDLPALDDRHLAAHRRLIDRYIRYHLGDGSELPALKFWRERAWEPSREAITA